MSGVVLLLALYAFMPWTGKSSPFILRCTWRLTVIKAEKYRLGLYNDLFPNSNNKQRVHIVIIIGEICAFIDVIDDVIA